MFVTLKPRRLCIKISVHPSLGQYMAGWSGSGENGKDYLGGLRGYNGNFSEVIGYNRFVTAEERRAITAYLNEKWISDEGLADVFPENVSIGLLNGATLELDATAHTIHGLSGNGGTIVNGDVTIDGVLEVTADANGNVVPYVFNGATLADELKIVLKGTPNAARIVVATGIAHANASTFVPPSSSWSVSVANGELSLSKGGTLLILR